MEAAQGFCTGVLSAKEPHPSLIQMRTVGMRAALSILEPSTKIYTFNLT